MTDDPASAAGPTPDLERVVAETTAAPNRPLHDTVLPRNYLPDRLYPGTCATICDIIP